MSVARRNCSVDGCTRCPWARGWCLAHYKRWRKHGDPTIGGPLRGSTPLERFMQKVEKTTWPTSCWLWTGCVGDGGYGQVRSGGRAYKAHRFGYELLVGPVPDDLDLDHLCRVRRCVNPDHLEPVTRSENLRRGAAARKGGAQCR